MKNFTDFNKQCIFDCYNLMRNCVDFEHLEDPEYIRSMLSSIKRYRIALPPDLYEHINDFVSETLRPIVNDPDFFSATKSPEYGSFNEEGLFEINSDKSFNIIFAIMCNISIDLECKIEAFAEHYIKPYLV